MNDNKVIPFRSPQPFDREAGERWNKISKSVQTNILENIWCSRCSGSASIILESAEMMQRDLILHGKCKTCGHEVCRVIEPDCIE